MAKKVMASKMFLRQKDDTCIATGYVISSSIAEHASEFANLPFKDGDLSKKTDDLKNSSIAAQTGDRKAKANLKVVRNEWKDMFGQTADAVSLQANGVEGVIIDAGMTPTSSTSKRKQKPAQPGNTVARPGNGKGNCALSVDAQPNVNGYIGILTSTDAKMEQIGDTIKITPGSGPIYIQAASRREILINGLPSYSAFCATVFTFNSAGSSPLSNSEEMGTQ